MHKLLHFQTKPIQFRTIFHGRHQVLQQSHHRFGYRQSPTAGASTYHSGIDIGAPPGSNIIAAFSGTVTYTGFYGAGGFTIMVENGTYTALYCHVSPNFMVNIHDTVLKGQVIAKVGPKNVYGVPGNNYKDSRAETQLMELLLVPTCILA